MAEAVDTGGDHGSAQSDDEYECKICYNHFDLDLHTPKLLDCSHTFCRECLEALHSRDGRGWRIGCPVCRHRTPVPEYRVQNLPDDTVLTEAIVLKTLEPVSSSNTDVQTGPAVPSAGSQQGDDSCRTCKQVAFATGCVCAIFSFLSTVVLLFLGLILVHNFKNITPRSGPACLFVASVLALFSLILTWLLCMLRTDLNLKPAASVPSLI
ncbi:putative E3 ubiquitin-protein ligase RNF183 [Larimichthys crocea]|uniref:Putative E3 ubiquitin-protein ligase RNF183 n=1 Tax=Larimichthys crocea TaxID=215358 RepID=A0A6G0IIE0_LARCR|nr:RING finger protein 224 [Larimichthys crocea]KAE8290966.1 putative E3 ubiquitin-protein ligase RNF183 [Larimichthys crocea]